MSTENLQRELSEARNRIRDLEATVVDVYNDKSKAEKRVRELEAGIQSLSKFHGKTEEDVLQIIERCGQLEAQNAALLEGGVEASLQTYDEYFITMGILTDGGDVFETLIRRDVIDINTVPGQKRKARIIPCEPLESIRKLPEQQKDLDPKFVKIVNERFKDLISCESDALNEEDVDEEDGPILCESEKGGD